MSFLNPVNEPVLRFRSTDAGAPQINYNARVAGDVKAVLKACLVTGYGAVASAGWTAVNEVGNVIEFVSPSAAMGDYRIGVDDSTTTKTDWYYQYQGARVNPLYSAPTKNFTYVDKANSANGWQLLVTERGLLLIEILYYTAHAKTATRITYFGQIKSAIESTVKNIIFFNLGLSAAIEQPRYIYSNSNYAHIAVATYTSTFFIAATSTLLSDLTFKYNTSNLGLISAIYMADSTKNILIGQLPPLLSKIVNKANEVYGVIDTTLEGRNTLHAPVGYASPNTLESVEATRVFLVPTDYWEY